jgi:RND superfamily putative drug exporter
VKGFGSGGNNPPLVAVTHLPTGVSVDSASVRSEITDVARRGAAALPGARVADLVDGGPGFVSADRSTTFGYFYPVPEFTGSDPYAKALPTLRAALAQARVAGQPVAVTGATVLASGGASGTNSVLVETILAGLAALIVLAVVFGSLLALLPLLIAIVAIPAAFIGIYTLTYATTVSTIVQNIVALVGLGVAIDYALLVVTRWREERAAGRSNREAVMVAAATAGSSVVFSGITVTVSLAALALTPVPFLRSIGLAGLLVPLMSVAVSTTLLPVILDQAGPRLEWSMTRSVPLLQAAGVAELAPGGAGTTAEAGARISVGRRTPGPSPEETSASRPARASAGAEALRATASGCPRRSPPTGAIRMARTTSDPTVATTLWATTWRAIPVHSRLTVRGELGVRAGCDVDRHPACVPGGHRIDGALHRAEVAVTAGVHGDAAGPGTRGAVFGPEGPRREGESGKDSRVDGNRVGLHARAQAARRQSGPRRKRPPAVSWIAVSSVRDTFLRSPLSDLVYDRGGR